MRIRFHVILVLLLLLATMTQTISGKTNSSGNIVVKGYIAYSDIEGGCYYLDGDNEINYELLYDKPLPPTGTHVLVLGKIRKDMVSICQLGPILQAKYIFKIP